jgi:hypothetical protein
MKFNKWLKIRDPKLCEGMGGKAMDIAQGVGDVAGMIPAIGAPIDAANAAVSLARGDVVGAGLRAASAIPGNVIPMGAVKSVPKLLGGAAKAGKAGKVATGAAKIATMRSKQKKK